MHSDHRFCRIFLTRVLKDVREHGVSEELIKTAWAYKFTAPKTTFEFHLGKGSQKFYCVPSNCDCLWSAKAEGWLEYLRQDHQGKIKLILCPDPLLHLIGDGMASQG